MKYSALCTREIPLSIVESCTFSLHHVQVALKFRAFCRILILFIVNASDLMSQVLNR